MAEHGVRNPPFELRLQPVGPHAYMAVASVAVANNGDVDIHQASAHDLVTVMCRQRGKRAIRLIDNSFCDHNLEQGQRIFNISIIVFVQDIPIA